MFNVPSGAPAGDGAAPADDIDDLLGMPSQREGPSGGDDDADAEKKPGSGLDLDALFAAPAENDAGAPPGRTTTGGATSTTTR